MKDVDKESAAVVVTVLLVVERHSVGKITAKITAAINKTTNTAAGKRCPL